MIPRSISAAGKKIMRLRLVFAVSMVKTLRVFGSMPMLLGFSRSQSSVLAMISYCSVFPRRSDVNRLHAIVASPNTTRRGVCPACGRMNACGSMLADDSETVTATEIGSLLSLASRSFSFRCKSLTMCAGSACRSESVQIPRPAGASKSDSARSSEPGGPPGGAASGFTGRTL